MAGKDLVVAHGKREDIKSTASELDVARMEYEEEYSLNDLLDEEETFTGVTLSPMLVPKDQKAKEVFAYLNFWNDEDETFTKVGVNFKFGAKAPKIFKGSKLYPLVSAITGLEDEYIQVNYEALREALKDVTSITIRGVEIDTGDFEYIGFEVVEIKK